METKRQPSFLPCLVATVTLSLIAFGVVSLHRSVFTGIAFLVAGVLVVIDTLRA